MTQSNHVEFGDVVRRFGEFEAMREAVDEMDSKIIDEITRLVSISAANAGWNFGFEGEEYLRWWFAPYEWRRTSHEPNGPYDFEMYFSLTRGGFPCSQNWPLTPSFLGHLLGWNNSRLVIRCFIHRMRTTSFIELLTERPDILTPMVDLKWEFDETEGYLEYPLNFSSIEITQALDHSDLGFALQPIASAVELLTSDLKTALFAKLLRQGVLKLNEKRLISERKAHSRWSE